MLIAPAKHLSALAAQEASATAFPDANAIGAVKTIIQQQPAVVVLEHSFAATSRGIVLVNRIKADPSLAHCEIGLVTHGATEPTPPVVPDVLVPAPGAPLDDRGTRRVPRAELAADAEVLVDGKPVAMVDFSAAGIQVVSHAALRPSQRVRVTLPDQDVPLNAAVTLAEFEMGGGAPRYRAGLEFQEGDAAALERFLADHLA